MLPSLEGFAAALLGRLDEGSLATLVGDLQAFSATIAARGDLSAVLTDTSLTPVVRGQVVGELVRDKVSEPATRLCVYAATKVPAQDMPSAIDELAHAARAFAESGAVPHAVLSLLDARRRVAGYADAVLDEVDTENFTAVEDDLFRWARTVEGNIELRRVLLDRDAPLASRLGLAEQLLGGKVEPVSLELARFAIAGGRPRDLVGTLDFLVDYVALSRDWRVARVHTARELTDDNKRQLVDTLAALTGRSVELQVAEEPGLLSGVLVEIGDLRLDATTRGRLATLREALNSGRTTELASNQHE